MTGRVFLVGMMGAGKSTVGRRLADRLGWRYVDSDEEVEAATGRTVREIFEAGGEAAFRPLETAALLAALEGPGPEVVSVAGGAVLDPANRELLRRSGTVVWLRATPETLARRVVPDEAVGGHRPLLGADPAGVLRRLHDARRVLYAEVADAVVDVDALGPDDVVASIVAFLGGDGDGSGAAAR